MMDLGALGGLMGLLFAGVVVIAILRWFVGRGGEKRVKAGAWAWYARPRTYLTTKAEAAFEQALAGMLRRAGRERWRIHVQVAMSAIFDGIEARRPPNWRGPAVPPWCLDYVLTDRGRIMAIIELNDRSHRRANRRRRDANLAEGCARLGVPLLFVEENRWAAAEAWIAELG